MKNINELTEKEAEEILEFVYPGKTPISNSHKYDYWVSGLKFESEIDENGYRQITFDGRPIIGILYHDDQDNRILYFEDSKVMLWLYKHGYDIEKQLEYNQNLSDVENDLSNMSYGVLELARGVNGFREGYEQNWTLEYVQRRCKELYKNYYMKDASETELNEFFNHLNDMNKK